MTNELKRLRQALGAPDFQLHEIQREQRLMEAASRWPILRDVAPDYSAPNRKINVDLSVKNPSKAEPAIVRLQTKQAAPEPAKPSPAPKAAKSKSKGAAASASEVRTQTGGQLSNVFLRLKHLKKGKSGPGDDKIAVL